MDGIWNYFVSVLISTKNQALDIMCVVLTGEVQFAQAGISLAGIINFAVSNPALFSHSQVLADQTECKKLKGSQLPGIQPEMWNKPLCSG